MSIKEFLFGLFLAIGSISYGQDSLFVSYFQVVKTPVNQIFLSDIPDSTVNPLEELDDENFKVSLYCNLSDTTIIDSVYMKLGTGSGLSDLHNSQIAWDASDLDAPMSYERQGSFLKIGMTETMDVDSVYLEFYFKLSDGTNSDLYNYPNN